MKNLKTSPPLPLAHWAIATAVFVVAGLLSATAPQAAQVPKGPIVTPQLMEQLTPKLTPAQNDALTIKLQAMRIAELQAEPRAIAEAIEVLIRQRQDTARQALQDAQSYLDSLQVTGWTFDMASRTYTPTKKVQ